MIYLLQFAQKELTRLLLVIRFVTRALKTRIRTIQDSSAPAIQVTIEDQKTTSKENAQVVLVYYRTYSTRSTSKCGLSIVYNDDKY